MQKKIFFLFFFPVFYNWMQRSGKRAYSTIPKYNTKVSGLFRRLKKNSNNTFKTVPFQCRSIVTGVNKKRTMFFPKRLCLHVNCTGVSVHTFAGHRYFGKRTTERTMCVRWQFFFFCTKFRTPYKNSREIRTVRALTCLPAKRTIVCENK